MKSLKMAIILSLLMCTAGLYAYAEDPQINSNSEPLNTQEESIILGEDETFYWSDLDPVAGITLRGPRAGTAASTLAASSMFNDSFGSGIIKGSAFALPIVNNTSITGSVTGTIAVDAADSIVKDPAVKDLAVKDFAGRLRLPEGEIRVISITPSEYTIGTCKVVLERPLPYMIEGTPDMIEGALAVPGQIMPQPYGRCTYTIRQNNISTISKNGMTTFIEGIPAYQILGVEYFDGSRDVYVYRMLGISSIEQFDKDGRRKAVISYSGPDDVPGRDIQTVTHFNEDGTVKYLDEYRSVTYYDGNEQPVEREIYVYRYEGEIRTPETKEICVFEYKGPIGQERLQACIFVDGTTIRYQNDRAEVVLVNGEEILRFAYANGPSGDTIATIVYFSDGRLPVVYEGLADPADVVAAYRNAEIIQKARQAIDMLVSQNNLMEEYSQQADAVSSQTGLIMSQIGQTMASIMEIADRISIPGWPYPTSPALLPTPLNRQMAINFMEYLGVAIQKQDLVAIMAILSNQDLGIDMDDPSIVPENLANLVANEAAALSMVTDWRGICQWYLETITALYNDCVNIKDLAINDIAARLRVAAAEIKLVSLSQNPDGENLWTVVLNRPLPYVAEGTLAAPGQITPQPYGRYTYIMKAVDAGRGVTAYLVDKVLYPDGSSDEYVYKFIHGFVSDVYILREIMQYDDSEAPLLKSRVLMGEDGRIERILHYKITDDIQYVDEYDYPPSKLVDGMETSEIIVRRYEKELRTPETQPLCVFTYRGVFGQERLIACEFLDGTIISYENDLAQVVRDASGAEILHFSYDFDESGNITTTHVYFNDNRLPVVYKGLADPVDLTIIYGSIKKAEAVLEMLKTEQARLDSYQAEIDILRPQVAALNKELNEVAGQLAGLGIVDTRPPVMLMPAFLEDTPLTHEAVNRMVVELELAIERGDIQKITEVLGNPDLGIDPANYSTPPKNLIILITNRYFDVSLLESLKNRSERSLAELREVYSGAVTARAEAVKMYAAALKVAPSKITFKTMSYDWLEGTGSYVLELAYGATGSASYTVKVVNSVAQVVGFTQTTRNAAGLIIKETSFTYDYSTGDKKVALNEVKVYTYDTAGALSTETKTTIKYSNAGYTKEVAYFNASNISASYYSYYKYDLNNRMTLYAKTCYDADMLRTKYAETAYVFLNINGVNTSKTASSYACDFKAGTDSMLNETSNVYSYYDSGVVKNKTTEYANYTNLAASYYRYWEYDSTGRNTAYSSTSYNADGLRTKFTSENYLHININGVDTKKAINAYVCNYVAGTDHISDSTFTGYSYYNNGAVKTKNTTYVNYVDFSKSYNRKYEYDSAGRQTLYSQTSYDTSGGRTKVSAEKYVYMNIGGKDTKKVGESYLCNFEAGTDLVLNETLVGYSYYDTGIVMKKDVSYVDHVNGSKSYHKIFHYDPAGKQIRVETVTARPDLQGVNEDLFGAMSIQDQIAQNKSGLPKGVMVVPQTKDKGLELKAPGEQRSVGSGS